MVYLCSGYSNYGSSFCTRNKIDESKLLFLIQPKLGNEITRELIEENIDEILVDEKGNIEIYYYNYDKSILAYNKLIR